jgi:hypothetical protein
MRRFFTFGCSFTNYLWPTWADILSIDYPYFQNWGHSGLGNRAIAERVAEAHVKNRFTKDDIVIVQWTSHLRHDWMHFGHPRTDFSAWRTKGSVYSPENIKMYGGGWINMFWDEKAYFVNTLNHIVLTQGLLDSIGCTWYMTSMSDQSKLSIEISDRTVNGEHPDEKGGFFHVWEKSPDLLEYKHQIWEEQQGHWITPMLDVCNKNPEEHYIFAYDKNNDQEVEKSLLKEKGKWMDPHPSVKQHGDWLILLKEKLNGESNLSNKQQEFIKKFTDLHSPTLTYREFENKIRSIGWGIEPSYRGF